MGGLFRRKDKICRIQYRFAYPYKAILAFKTCYCPHLLPYLINNVEIM